MTGEPHVRTGDWRLVAPAYAVDASGGVHRDTGPSLQKFGGSDFMRGFLADPRASLPFDDCDWVYRVQTPAAPVPGSRRSRLSPWTLARTATRKLFLPTHRRFYLVACELHCEMPGFPDACPDDVCEVGFVLRRRRVALSDDTAPGAVRHLRRVVSSAGDLEVAARRYQEVATGAPVAAAPREMAVAVGEARRAHADLREWADRVGAVEVVEGWFPTGRDGEGAWRSVKERPGRVRERVLPMTRLVAPPDDPDHPAAGRAVWFGVVGTATADHDAAGRAQLDDRSLYEIRCFVRRHRPGCPRTGERDDCCGELTWSRPTTAFQLASQQDLAGTANTPVTVHLPDIPALLAQAAVLPRSQIAPVRFVSPPGSSLRFTPNGGIPTSGALGGAQICSFSIPLITIVATFVLNLFLPIVVLLFGLFALLRLKFCIPPSFQLSAELTAALSVAPPGADLDVALDAAASAQLRTALEDFLNVTLGADAGTRAVAAIGNDALAGLVRELAVTPPRPPRADRSADGGPGDGAAASPCAVLVDGGTP